MADPVRPDLMPTDGDDPAGRGTDKWEALTNTERQVVELVGDGLTNAEIAAERFVSVRTVESHVSHILAKLRIPSRRQLAREAARRHGQ